MWITDIDHLQIAAPKGCEAEARRFFGDLLGLKEIEKPEPLQLRRGCWFRIGSRQLHIGVVDWSSRSLHRLIQTDPLPPFRNPGDL
jgi:catechol 2,3-dioxygenase-like lactoylglutathione lyase family enzyme